MLPYAHVGHYLWILYAIPFLFVVVAIVRNAFAHRQREDEEGG